MKQSLDILFLCGWYPSRVLPYNGDFIQRHAEAVAKQHSVTVFHIISDKNCTKNISIVSSKINGIHTHIAYLKKSKNPIKKMVLFFFAFQKLLQIKSNFNLVHLNTTYPFGIFSLYLKWFKKLPYIISEHWTGYHFPQSKNISFYQKYITTIITKNASYVCPVSNDLKKSMLALGFKGTYKRVPNVVNTTLFYPITKTNSVFTITHISNMVNQHKNIKGILRVVKKLENKIDTFTFKIIGENAQKYIPYAKKIGIDFTKINFIDQVPHNKIATALKESDLFILFSNYENLPCVILEAFSCGIPVISTNVGGVNEFFPKDFGFLIDIKDEEALLSKIITIANNYTVDKTKMHTYAEDNFSEKSICKQFTKLYKSTLKEHY